MQRVYVIEFDGFVKIGITQNIERRLSQLPYKKERKFYCTEKTAQARKIETILHKAFAEEQKKDAEGREYFNIEFDDAVTAINDTIKLLDLGVSDRKAILGVYLLHQTMKMPEYMQNRFFGFCCGFMTREGMR